MWNGKKKAVTFSYDDGVTQFLFFPKSPSLHTI